ncbi:PepSY-associated TM helix domain-containing protein [Blastomonas fulva]|jgi:uncharacterized iron-regulated membrane protein|uniref:PepSY-associated TM helix domain-containing protein n=1 Tax=Blastomonas fulva TaxID=1550728 RepID=UPI003D27A12F
MSLVNQATSKRLLAVHGWSGVLLGLFLYVVVITGTVAVLSQEIGAWSISGAKTQAPFSQPLDARVRQLAQTVEPKYREDITIYPNASGTMLVFFHTHGVNSAGKPDDVGVRFLLEPGTLKVAARDEGYGSELPEDRDSALDYFISILHISLHAPDPVGLYLTGLAGFVMLFAVISGIILHRHLIKDLFVAPRLSSRLLNRRDRHILAGSWSLPFGFLLAFTGTFFSFAGAIGLPIVAMVAFGGDQEKMTETLVGAPETVSERPADMANLDSMIARSVARTGTQPSFVSIAHWGTADSRAYLYHLPSGRAVEASTHVYEMASGRYHGVKPDLGTRPSFGSTVYAWMGPLHFGHFAGLLSKLIWVSLGLAASYVTLTGLRLWVERRPDMPSGRVLGVAIPMVGYGVPIGLTGAALGFLLNYPAGDPVSGTAFGFVWGCAFAVLLASVLIRRGDASAVFMAVLGLTMAALPLVRLATGGQGWLDLVGAGHAVVVMIDLMLLTGGAFALHRSRRGDAIARSARAEGQASAAVPAE